MAAWRNPATSITTVVVYLAGLVGGALHHHGEQGHHAATPTRAHCLAQQDTSAAGCAEDAGVCAVCVAVHQAKTPPPAVAALAAVTLTADAIPARATRPPVPFLAPAHARAPPTL